jgi:hypothetical protein
LRTLAQRQARARILLDDSVKGSMADHHKGRGGNGLLDTIAAPVPSLDLVFGRLPDVRASVKP